MNPHLKNSQHLQAEFEWLHSLIEVRLDEVIQGKTENVPFDAFEGRLSHLNGFESGYSNFIYNEQLSPEQRLILLLTLAPHIYPEVLFPFSEMRTAGGQIPPEIGGAVNKHTHLFLPTAETALFLLSGRNLHERLRYMHLFHPEEGIFGSHAVEFHQIHAHEPPLNAMLVPSKEMLEAFTSGRVFKPVFGPDFPAKQVSTQLNWDDLVLEEQTLRQLEDIKTWIIHGETLLNNWGMGKRLKPGYRALFFGPPGTGKTLTASLIGKEAGREVYRVDLSTVVSKYIGETEKNLERVFSKAERRNWILFFDEADAIFGKRTRVKDAHDRFANQEVSYLLQRVEDFDGIVILASNEKENMDEAFSRRFQSMISFPMPKARERQRLWETNLPAAAKLGSGIDLSRIAEKFELAGGSIINIVRYCAMEAVKRNPPVITVKDMEEGLKREYQKMGRMM